MFRSTLLAAGMLLLLSLGGCRSLLALWGPACGVAAIAYPRPQALLMHSAPDKPPHRSLLRLLDPIYGRYEGGLADRGLAGGLADRGLAEGLAGKGRRAHRDPPSIEHVVPRSVIRRSGVVHSDVFRQGRSPPNASRVEPTADLHNLFACPKSINSARSNFRFASRHVARSEQSCSIEAAWEHVGHDNFVDKHRRLFHVNPRYRGVVARAVLYMHSEWDCSPDDVIEGGLETAWMWHTHYPVSTMEVLHNYLALQIQNTTNPYIVNSTDPAVLLEELFAIFHARRRARLLGRGLR